MFNFNDAPECVRRFAITFMQSQGPRHLLGTPPDTMRTFGDLTGLDVASHREGLRWLAEFYGTPTLDGSIVDQVMTDSLRGQFAEYIASFEQHVRNATGG